MNWRDIPHPHYGNYGGGTNKGLENDSMPIDYLDAIFKIHDINLKSAENKFQEYLADSTLFLDLTEANLSDLVYPIYGRIYWFGSLLVFGFVHYFRKPRG